MTDIKFEFDILNGHMDVKMSRHQLSFPSDIQATLTIRSNTSKLQSIFIYSANMQQLFAFSGAVLAKIKEKNIVPVVLFIHLDSLGVSCSVLEIPAAEISSIQSNQMAQKEAYIYSWTRRPCLRQHCMSALLVSEAELWCQLASQASSVC